MFKSRIASLLVLGLALGIAVMGPISQASADNGPGGDNYNHFVWATCSYPSISVDIKASGTFNGQVLTTTVWAHVPRGPWQAITGWKNTTIYPNTTQYDYFNNPYTTTVTVDLYTQPLTTTGGYREVSVEYYWWSGTQWVGHDFRTASYIQDVVPSIYTVNYYNGASATCLT